jgi:hypothetical protein
MTRDRSDRESVARRVSRREHLRVEVAEGLGWLRPHLDSITERYRILRSDLDPIPAFERTLAEVLDEPSYERIQSFFDGEHDAVYGMNAGERARTQLRDSLEMEMDRRPGGAASRWELEHGSGAAGEVTDIKQFYDENPVRRSSEEIRFGNHWSWGGPFVNWDIFWVVDTGELVAYRCALGEGLPKLLDGVVGDGKHPVEVLLVEPDLAVVRDLLGDWEGEQDKRDSYAWLRQRLGLAVS